ncbi:MAG: hypothetical protein SFY32_14390 [Bacteroidota bacterium]|nr:hypothetical protein [Bacteroidota bacterium]
MFDIIGFSNLIREKGSEGLYQLYSRSILPMLQHAAMPESIIQNKDGRNISIPDPKSQRVYYSFFSDTIIYYTKDDSWDSFNKIIFTSLELLKSGFNGAKAPYRGAIGYGDIIFNDIGILLGTSIIDAYKGEGSQMWSGCILTDACEKFCCDNNYINEFYKLFETVIRNEKDEDKISDYKKAQKTIVKYVVHKQRKSIDKPIEYFEKEHYVLDWTQKVYEGAADKSFNRTDIPHQEMIRVNTIAFENWARQNNKIK